MAGATGQNLIREQASAAQTATERGISVVVTTFNDSKFLPDALNSIFAQTVPATEVIVVDDGSDASCAPDVSLWPSVTLIRKENGGLASARNTGLAAAKSEFILFLDADDRLPENALADNLHVLTESDGAAAAHGAYINVDERLVPINEAVYSPIGACAYDTLLQFNTIGMHGAVLYRRDALAAIGGFDETLRLCEDYDVYLKLAKRHRIVSHPQVVAEYRRHGTNISRDHHRMMAAALAVHARYRPTEPDRLRAWRNGRVNWSRFYILNQVKDLDRHGVERQGVWRLCTDLFRFARDEPVAASKAVARRVIPEHLLPLVKRATKRGINFGSFGETEPISRDFGFSRGLPIDRFYIERFLSANSSSIRGTVLEVGDASYSRAFGGDAVTKQEVIHVHRSGPDVTIVGDLQTPQLLRSRTFDCVILTQTLQFIYDFDAAVRNIYEALKPGGSLLTTTPGITQIDRDEWKTSWYWSFTEASIRMLFHKYFGEENVTIDVDGNVYAATAFLQGLCVADVAREKLDVKDGAYPMIISIHAKRREDAAS
jgi:glycosyltransferase involved in cell wall biosynthesis